MEIKASQIEKWPSEDKEARAKLAVLLRKLILGTVTDCVEADFPAYENSERHGWDGILEAGGATPWTPKGKSGWEFSTEKKNVKTKANKDYDARIKSTTETERAETAFVFATTRNWPGKRDWQKEKNAEGKWREVKALDASDLEQWLERSTPVQIWFAEQLRLDTDGLGTLEEAWQDWVSIQPENIELTPELFGHAVSVHLENFKNFLEENKRPSVLTVASDSTKESLGFLHCLFNEIPEYKDGRKQVLIASKPESLEKILPALSSQTTLIARTPKVQEVFGLAPSNPKIAISLHGAVDPKPNLVVPMNRIEFINALQKMGAKNSIEAERYARESGCSPTVLRRRISGIPHIRRPEWVADEKTSMLIPLALFGVWNKKSPAEREIVAKLASQDYDKVEKIITKLLQYEDSPVWIEGRYYGFVSKKDMLFAVAENVTEADINVFFERAEDLLSKDNRPSNYHSLPVEFRRHAFIRHHSYAMYSSVCDSLVLLAIHGNELFQKWLGDIKPRLNKLIHSLLAPLTFEKLLFHETRLKKYAEAAPEEFLSIIEAELEKTNSFLRKSLSFTLLSVLEQFSWVYLDRVTTILAKLSEFKIAGYSTNIPFESLSRIYCSWHPQTAAALDWRKKNFELLAKNFPDTAIQLLGANLSRAIETKTKCFSWRDIELGPFKEVLREEEVEFLRAALDAILGRDLSNEELGSLVKHINAMENEYQLRIWKLIDERAENASDTDKAYLRDQIRQHVLMEKCDQASNAYEKLLPQDLIQRHLWLFQIREISSSPDEKIDYDEYQKQIDTNHQEAFNEILRERGIEGVFALLTQCRCPIRVGEAAKNCLWKTDMQLHFVKRCLALKNHCGNKGVEGFLSEAEPEAIFQLLNGLENNEQTHLLHNLPFCSKTWRLLDQLEPAVKQRYWLGAGPAFGLETEDHIEAANSFLAAGRPLQALMTVQPEKTETGLLKKILFAVSRGVPEKEWSILWPYLNATVTSLGKRSGIDKDELAFLEFSFLNTNTFEIPNLERKIAEEPLWFVKVILIWMHAEDEKEGELWKYYNPFASREITVKKFQLMLGRVQRIPGTDCNGSINAEQLLKWIKKVFELFKQNNQRQQVGDIVIGKLLGQAPREKDGRISPAICEALEHFQSQDMANYFRLMLLDRSGIRIDTGGDGTLEREVAEKYHEWAKQHKESNQYFVAKILEAIAEKYEKDAAEIFDQDAKVFNRTGYGKTN